MLNFDAVTNIVMELIGERYPQACAAIVGGSFASGSNTASSDIDLLLLFDQVDHAWRETLIRAGTTVELYGHDLATFDYFCRRQDRPGGRVPMAMMVIEGKSVLPPGAAHAALLSLAQAIYAEGPPPLDEAALRKRRYEITTLLEDLVDSERPAEALAVAAKLYELLADFQLRSRHTWSGLGKHLARRLSVQDPGAARQLDLALRAVATDLADGKRRFTAVTEAALHPYGGQLLEGFSLHAPAQWRSGDA